MNAVAAELGHILFFLYQCASRLITTVVSFIDAIGVQTKLHAIDFSKRDGAAWDSLADALAPLDIGVLGNLIVVHVPLR